MINPMFLITSSDVGQMARELLITQKYSLNEFLEALTNRIAEKFSGESETTAKIMASTLAHIYFAGWADRGIADMSCAAMMGLPPAPRSFYQQEDGSWVDSEVATTDQRIDKPRAVLWPDTKVQWL